jgi:hypothetical protein
MTTNTPDRPDDEALARLRAADPAPDAAPDSPDLEAALRARVPEAMAPATAGVGAATTPTGPDGPLTGPDGPGGAIADELAERRERRSRRRVPLQVAAAVAGVLVVGAGGYALGAGGGTGSAGDTAAESSVLAPIQLDAAGSAQEESTLTGTGQGAADQGFSASSRVATDMAYPGSWGGRTVFAQDGLSTQGGSAEAWAYDAAGVFSGETARRVADVLGVSGDVSQEWGAYVVGPRDGSGPSVSLQPDGLASVSFHDPSKDPWGCVAVVPMPAEDGGGSGAEGSEGAVSPDVMPVEPGTCAEADHGVPPGRDAAVDQLGGVLTALGLDAAGYEIVAEDQVAEQEAPRATNVTAYEVVDGQRTGTSWNATYSGAGLASLYGSLAPRVTLGTYDVVSPAGAVERLGDPRFGAGGPVVWARAEGLEQAVPEIAPVEPEVPTVPSTVGEGARFAWPVTDVTITDARLGTAVQHQPDGAAVLLPAYELSDADGNVWSVVAVADDQLDFAPVG